MGSPHDSRHSALMRRVLFALAALFAAGCAVRSALTPPEDVNLRPGYSLYVNKCGACHALFPPGSRSAQEWVQSLSKMEKKVKLSAEEEEQLFLYLSSGAR